MLVGCTSKVGEALQQCTRQFVKKEGPNTGRRFFACAGPRESPCKYYQFGDEDSAEFGRSSARTVTREAANKVAGYPLRLLAVVRERQQRHLAPSDADNTPETPIRTGAGSHGL